MPRSTPVSCTGKNPFGMATSGDDVVLVYAPAAEQRYVKSGDQSPALHGLHRDRSAFSGLGKE